MFLDVLKSNKVTVTAKPNKRMVSQLVTLEGRFARLEGLLPDTATLQLRVRF